MKPHYWPLNRYILLIFTIAMLITGCNISPSSPSNTSIQPTTTTLVDDWNILEQRSFLIPQLPLNKTCPITNGQVLPYTGFTCGHAVVSPKGTDLPFYNATTLSRYPPANGTPIPNGDWFHQKVVWFIQPCASPRLLHLSIGWTRL